MPRVTKSERILVVLFRLREYFVVGTVCQRDGHLWQHVTTYWVALPRSCTAMSTAYYDIFSLAW
jgi:hypothetical protein